MFTTRRYTNSRLPPVASLGLVSPEAASPLKKTDDLFSHHCLSVLHCHPYFLLKKLTTSFLLITATFIDFTTCPTLVCLLFFVNSATFFSFGCHPLEGVTRSGPPASLSYATVYPFAPRILHWLHPTIPCRSLLTIPEMEARRSWLSITPSVVK